MNSGMKITCPTCSHTAPAVKGILAKQSVICPHCGTPFIWDSGKLAPLEPAPTSSNPFLEPPSSKLDFAGPDGRNAYLENYYDRKGADTGD